MFEMIWEWLLGGGWLDDSPRPTHPRRVETLRNIRARYDTEKNTPCYGFQLFSGSEDTYAENKK